MKLFLLRIVASIGLGYMLAAGLGLFLAAWGKWTADSIIYGQMSALFAFPCLLIILYIYAPRVSKIYPYIVGIIPSSFKHSYQPTSVHVLQALRWFHRWVGLLLGLFLYCVMVTGTLAIYSQELTNWMQPETKGFHFIPLTEEALYKGYEATLAEHKKGHPAFLLLPTPRDPTLRVEYFDGHEFIGPVLEARHGNPLSARPTVGGQFFFDFHYTFHLGRTGEKWFTALMGFCLITLVISGVVLHWPFMWTDLFLLRPLASRLRFLLDIHVVGGVFLIPFLIGMAYSATLFNKSTYLPFQMVFSYFTSNNIHSPEKKENQHKSHDASAGIETPPAAKGEPIHLTSHELTQFVGQADRLLGKTGFIMFRPDQTQFFQAVSQRVAIMRDSVVFDNKTGIMIAHKQLISPAEWACRGLEGAHMGNFYGPYGRFLYFMCGVIATLAIGSGLLYFLYKEQKKICILKGFLRALYIFIPSCLIGLPLACVGLMILSRLLPVTFTHRILSETVGFFLIWGSCFFYAFCQVLRSKYEHTLRGLTWVFMGMCLFMPLFDKITFPKGRIFWEIDGGSVVIGCVLSSLLLRKYIPAKKRAPRH